MKIAIYLYCIGVAMIMTSCEKKDDFFLDNTLLNRNKAYLLFRGTNSKEGVIAMEYSAYNKSISHVGIVVYLEDEWRVYHILNSRNKSDIRYEPLAYFFDVKNEKIHYAGIWKIGGLSKEELSALKRMLKEFETTIVKFDRGFDSDDASKLYCSEFINYILHCVSPNKFYFPLHTIPLKRLHAIYLRRDSLSYYPVDAFQCHENISLLAEWHFSSD